MQDFIFIMAAPLTACLILVGIHAYLGLHVLAREVIFVDLSLAQIAALGSTLAFLVGYDLHSLPAYLFSLGATFIGAAIFALTRLRHSRIPQEAIIGIVYAVSTAAGILAIDNAPHGAEHIKHMLTGAILWVTWTNVAQIAVIYVFIGLVHYVFRARFLTLSFGKSVPKNWNARAWDFFFYATFGFAITSSVEIAGVLLVFTFLIVPAVCAVLFTDHIGNRLAIGWGVGFVTSALGCILSYLFDLPTGATIVCLFGFTLLLLSLIKRLFSA